MNLSRYHRGVLALIGAFAVVASSVTAISAMGATSISGTVFEDLAGDLLTDGPIGGAANPGVAGVTVRLYHDDGGVVDRPDLGDTEVAASRTSTDAAGRYSFGSLGDGTYWVVVESTTVGGSGAWAEQTWGPVGATGVSTIAAAAGAHYGGRTANASDRISVTNLLDDAEHVARVAISGTDVTGIDFGFSFNAITNTLGGDTTDDHPDTARTVQGSLRQFLTNANAIGGSNAMRFVPVTATNATDAGSALHRITVANPLPVVVDTGTILDGTVYSTGGVVLDLAPGAVGIMATSPGFVVGVDGLALPTVDRPDLELVGTNGVDHAFDVTGASFEISGFSIRGFDTAGLALTGTSSAAVSGNVVGGTSDPGPGLRNGHGIEVDGGSTGSISANLIAYNGLVGINFPTDGADWSIDGNEFASNGLDATWPDQIRLVGGSNLSITGNHIHDGEQIGIEIRVAVGTLTVSNNTIDANGQGGNEVAGIRDINQLAVAHLLERNVITNNAGPGVLISGDGAGPTPPTLTTLSQNTFGGNGGFAVDLTTDPASRVVGDGPNPLSGNGCGTGTQANDGVDRPVITAAYAPGPYLRIIGTGCANSSIEFFSATADGDGSDTSSGTDYGEPLAYLASTTVDTDGTFDVFLAAGLGVGETITALMTDPAGNTSEMAANVTIAAANIPAITVAGTSPVDVEAGTSYSDAGATATDVEDGDLTGSMVTVDPVDPGALGSYTVTYDVTDGDGFPAVGQSRTVNVADTTDPVITLNGLALMTIEGASTFLDPGATATDSFEGDLTASVTVIGSVDTLAVGDHPLDYSVADSSGNGDTKTRTVRVVDTTNPTLTLVGSPNPVITQNSIYVDPGATATDLVDGDLSGDISTVGTVNTAIRGTYDLTFSVSDFSGNSAADVVRSVLVADPNPPVVTVLGVDPVTLEAFDPYADPGATALDAEDGDLTGSIVVTSSVDTTSPGSYVVTYTVADQSGNPASATRTVNVVDTTAPTITLNGGNPITVVAGHTFTDPGATATDLVDGDLSPAITISGTVDTATPNTTTLTYQVADAAGNSMVETRSVQVLENHPPVVSGESYTVAQGGVVAISAPGLLLNDSDPDGDNLTVALVTNPSHGILTLGVDGSFNYRHNNERVKSDQFTYEVRDGYGNSAVATVSISVALANRSPVALSDVVFVNEDSTVVFDPTANDSDPDGDSLTLVEVTNPLGGSTSIVGNDVHFRGNTNWNGLTRLTYTVTDGATSVSETVLVNVVPTNDAPTPHDDTFSVDSWERQILLVLSNDRDPEGDSLSITSVTTPHDGTVEITTGGHAAYTPNVGFIGSDTFSYTVADSSGASAQATVTIEVGRPDWVTEEITYDSGEAVTAAIPGPSAAAGVQFSSPSTQAVILFVGAFLQSLLARSVHLGLLLLALGWFVLFGYTQWWRSAARGRHYSVVLLDREDRLTVVAEPGSGEQIHRFDTSERRIRSVGRRRTIEGVAWLPVQTSHGRGWVEARYLTEDAARATFEGDVEDGKLLASFGRALGNGRQPEVSSRGVIDPATYERVDQLPLESGEAHQLASALDDPRTNVLIDRPHAPDSLRPAQLRNFHWITVVSADGPIWHVMFEYHRDSPAVVGIRREGATLPRLA